VVLAEIPHLFPLLGKLSGFTAGLRPVVITVVAEILRQFRSRTARVVAVLSTGDGYALADSCYFLMMRSMPFQAG